MWEHTADFFYVSSHMLMPMEVTEYTLKIMAVAAKTFLPIA
jgi:hypothetical protein